MMCIYFKILDLWQIKIFILNLKFQPKLTVFTCSAIWRKTSKLMFYTFHRKTSICHDPTKMLKDNKKLSNAGLTSKEQEKKNITWIGLTTAHSWETLVIFALNFKELNVHMNMGNVMGNVDWISKNFKSEGRLSIGSTGHKNMFITIGLSSSKLEAKAGIVGGAVDLGKIDTYVQLKEDNGTEPFHQIGE